MFEECFIRNRRFAPARFCGPLAGYTHSAFRRLLAELGGCGAVWTEMLATRQILEDNPRTSPWLRRRPQETCLVYQLMVSAGDPIERALDRLGEQGADAVDLNLACHAGSIRAQDAGSALFQDTRALETVVGQTRRHWPGLLTVKIRLGSRRLGWQTRLEERLRLLEDCGVDGLIVHTRFFEDKFKRRARNDYLPWITARTRLPVVANGDLMSAEQVRGQAHHLRTVQGIMIGRMAIVRPWLFANWERPQAIDYGKIWHTMYQYILEDFPADTALRRIQMFTKYYAANFLFGHQLRVAIAKATSLEEIRHPAEAFFNRNPAVLPQPNASGI